ncbi:MAG: chromosomal replication initiator protein DnaA [Clostridia bacterium]|nr:chromosomal replication initiator protein DnaA [Clostridia bacterium]
MARIDDIKVIWSMIKSDLYDEIGHNLADIWFDTLEVTDFDGESVTLSKNSDFHINVLKAKYKGMIEKKFESFLCIPIKVILVSTESLYKDHKTTGGIPDLNKLILEAADGNERKNQPLKSTEQPKLGSTMPPFNFEYTFDNFIVGSSNKFAHAACLAVATLPAQSYNPLFVYGPSGLGKTHMLYAITNKLKDANPDIKVIYIKGEDFTNQMIDSLSRQAMNEFREKYRSCDVLLIDDIQFIAGKTSTQEEFFHTFNALYENGKQIILTSDRPPRDIKTLEDRLVTRFEWGLIADVQPPDLELRTAIIKKKAEQVNVIIPDDVLSFLAENLRSNIRQIEGAIKKLGAKSFITGCEITMELARSCISELLGGNEPLEVTVDKIFTAVYKKYNIKKEDIIGKSRTKEIAAARHVTVYLIRTITEMSHPSIGKLLDRDHSTVISSLDAIEKKMRQNTIFRAEIEEMVKEIKGL